MVSIPDTRPAHSYQLATRNTKEEKEDIPNQFELDLISDNKEEETQKESNKDELDLL